MLHVTKVFKTDVNFPLVMVPDQGPDEHVTTKDSISFFVMALGHVYKMALIDDCG